MKKLLAILLLAVLALSLAACGDSHAPNTPLQEDDIALIRESDGAVISYGMTRAEIEKILGEPVGKQNALVLYEGGIRIFYRPRKVEKYTYNDGRDESYRLSQDELAEDEQPAAYIRWGVDSDTKDNTNMFRTVRGISLDAEIPDVLEKYGDKYAVTPSTTIEVSYVIDSETNQMITNEGEKTRLSLERDLIRRGITFYVDMGTQQLRSISVYDRFAEQLRS